MFGVERSWVYFGHLQILAGIIIFLAAGTILRMTWTGFRRFWTSSCLTIGQDEQTNLLLLHSGLNAIMIKVFLAEYRALHVEDFLHSSQGNACSPLVRDGSRRRSTFRL